MATTFEENTWVWMPDEEEAFIPAKVKATFRAGEAAELETQDGQAHSLDAKATEGMTAADEQVFSANVDNLIKLNDLNECALLHNLRLRFKQDTIYTYVSSILISVNPFKLLPLYTPEKLDEYKQQGGRNLPPHVFSIADEAYKSMLSDNSSQSVVISGESGAGKTEATKLILQFLAEVSGRAGSGGNQEGGLEQQILQANPVMESFGNAKTVRNNNSSRFGKLITINFDRAGTIVGGSIINYLLEKSRVVYQMEGERNYHVFYQLLAGVEADPELKRQTKLSGVGEDYNFLNQSGVTTIENVSDEKDFEDMKAAMDVLSISAADQLNVFRIIAGLLHFGNVEFEAEVKATEEDGARVKNMEQLQLACELLGLDPDSANQGLCFRNIGTRSVIMVSYNMEQAHDARDAMVKNVYSTLFNWLIVKINQSLSSMGTVDSASDARFIGVLDIFGFESFEVNSFEQLCINYCNEKLQFHFNEHIFRLEQEEYAREGVTVPDTAYVDNQPCLDLLELRGEGVFSMIDEEINVPKGSDEGFLNKLTNKHRSHSNFAVPKPKQCKDARMCFAIKHYAGEVAYNVTNFLEKNKDSVHADISGVLKRSTSELMQALFPKASVEDAGAARRTRGRSPSSAKKSATLGMQFKKQLGDLMSTLNATSPHFVRCMKPNALKKGNIFQAPMMLAQLRYAGLLEVCRIRQIGFPVRREFGAFFGRYKSIVPSATDVDSLLAAMESEGHIAAGSWAKGTSKVFLKNQTAAHLDEIREAAFIKEAIKVQKHMRRIIWQFKYRSFINTLHKLKEAVASRDEAELDHWLNMCGELPYNGNHLADVIAGKALLARLALESRTNQLLIDAVAKGEMSALTIALDTAAKINPPLDNEHVQAAKTMMAKLEERKSVREALKAAIASRDRASLESNLERAVALGLDTDETRQGAALKTRLEEEDATVTQLRTAIADRNLNLLNAFLGKMAEMGLETPEVAQATELKGVLMAELQARNAITFAIRERALEQLVEALAKASALGLDASTAEVTQGEELKLVLEQEAAAEVSLSAACETRTIPALDAAIASAEELKLTPAKCGPLAEALKMKAQIEAEAAATAALTAAVASNDAEALSAALAQAGSLGLAGAEVDAARAASSQLGAQSEIRSKLQAVAASDDMAAVTAALAEAEGLGVMDTAEALMCVATRDRLTRQQEALTQLDAALAGSNLQELSRAVAQCMGMGMGSTQAAKLTQAKEAVARLSANMKLGMQLKTAVKSRDASAIDEAIAKARTAGIPDTNEEFAAAIAVREQLNVEADIGGKLNAAIQARDTAAMRAAVAEAKAAGVDTDLVRQAEILADRSNMIDDTRAQMSAAMDSGDLDALNRAIEHVIELGFDDADVQSAKAKRDDLLRVREAEKNLEAASGSLHDKSNSSSGIAQEDLAHLQQALDVAASAGVPETSTSLIAAKAFFEHISAQLAVQVELTDVAANEDATLKMLVSALEKAEELGLNLAAMAMVRERVKEQDKERRAAQAAGTLEEEEDVDEEEMEKERQERLKKACNKKYHFTNYSNIRSVDDFAKGVILNKKRVKEGMLRWQGALITKSLLDLDKDLNKLSVRVHKCLLGYMGDKTMSFPATLAQDILQKGLENPELVDEIYMLIMKQLTGNPKPESMARGWQVMCMCVGTFPPSRDFENYVLNYILERKDAAGAVGNYARYALRRLEGMLSSGASGFVPSVEEIQAYKERPPILATIELVDGTPLTEELPITPDLNVGKVLEICTHFLDLQDGRADTFSVFVVDEEEAAKPDDLPPPPPTPGAATPVELTRTPRPLRSEDFMGDVVVQKARQGRKYRFVFKRKIFLRNADGASNDEMYNRLVYLQAADEVISGNIPLGNEAEVVRYTTMAVAVDLAEDFPSDVAGLVENALVEYVPLPVRENHTPEEWAGLVLAARGQIAGKDAEALQGEYVEALKEKALYGTHFFYVRKLNDVEPMNSLPGDLIAAFNSEGLHFLDATSRDVLVSFGYADIYRWGGSSVQFSLIIWNPETQDTFELVLTTYQAADMAALILDYINAIMAST